MLKVSSVLIGVASLERAKLFYQKVFGVTFDEFRPPFASFMLCNLEFNLEEDTATRTADWSKLYIGGRKNISFETDDLSSFLVLASNNGATIVQQPKIRPWGLREAIFSDLDGNEFVVEQKISQ